MGLFYSDATKLGQPNWGKVVLWFGLVLGLFGLAYLFKSSWPEGSTTLLGVFELAFPGILVLLGIETARVRG
jgi:hypothetical protein